MRPPRVVLSCVFGLSITAIAATQSTSSNTQHATTLPTVSKQRTGDLDTLLSSHVIRIGVPHSKTLYYAVKGVQYGLAYETGKAFEQYFNTKFPQRKNIHIQVFFVVPPREKAAEQLNNGFLDILAGGITVTPERQKLVDFSDPTYSNVNEIVVSAPNSARLSTLDDLSGKEVFVRKTSSYWEHLQNLNERLKKEKKEPITLTAVPEDLNDEDLLEMINAGLLPITVMNDWTAKIWSKFLPRMQLHSDIVLNSGGVFAWAVRKNSPKLLGAINDFFKTHRQGTAFGNRLVAKYTASTYMLRQAISPEGMKRFERTAKIFRKYSDKYRMDYLLMMAEGYQESGLNQQAKSSVGAIGVMQLMPATGEEMRVGDIHQEEPNIHAGVKYFHSMMERLYGNEPMDEQNKILFTFAAYNCGPARVKQLRAEAADKGLDPNVWLNNVEIIAANRVGAETVNYVANIYKYYVAYKLIAVEEERRNKAKESLKTKPS